MAPSSASVTADVGFGPRFKHEFDFTLEFEHWILTVLPAAFIIVSLPLLVRSWYNSTVHCRPGYLLPLKASFVAACIGIQAGMLALWSQNNQRRSSSSLAAASLSFIASVCLGPILYLEHRHTLKSNCFVALWLITTVLFDAVKSRSAFLRSDLYTIGVLTAVSGAMKIVLLLLDEVSKGSMIIDEHVRTQLGAEFKCGFFGRSLFVWINPLFFLGFNNILSAKHLRDLAPEYKSGDLSERFSRIWQPGGGKGPNALAMAVFSTLKSEFLWIAFPRFCFSIARISQSGLIYLVINFVENDGRELYKKVGLMIGAVLIYGSITISRANYEHQNYQFAMRFSAMLHAEVYKKSLRLTQAEAQKFAAASLLGSDVALVVHCISYFHNLWACALEIIICICLAGVLVKQSAILLLIPGLVIVVCGYVCGKYMPGARKLWNERVQRRVARATRTLGQVKAIKMVGLEKAASKYMQDAREDEIKHGVGVRKWVVTIITAGGITEGITGPLLIAGALFWTRIGSDFNARNVYTILSIGTLAIGPFGDILDAYSFSTSSLACIKRVQDYLGLEERQDNRNTDAASVNGENEKVSAESTEHSVENGKEIATVELQPIDRQRPPNRVIQLTNADIAFEENKDPILRNVSLSIDRTQRVMVVGATGSGKSTFMRTLLGETALVNGSIYVEAGNAGYCDQTTWIQNKTVRDNIVGQGDVDTTWYNSVVDACLLRKDISRFENGDDTIVGSKGGMLSGGQRHRVALARAVYSRSRYLFLDDVVAALDGNTASAIFTRLFGKDGILKKHPMTVVMTTYTMSHLEGADQVVLIEQDGTVSSRRNLHDKMFREKVEKIISKATSRSVPENEENFNGACKSDSKGGSINENKARQRGDTGIYLFYFRTFKRAILLMWALIALLHTFADNFPDAYMNIWLVKDAQNKLYYIGYAAIGASGAVFVYLFASTWFFHMVPYSALLLHRRLVDTIMRAKLSFITSTSHGVLLNLFSQDMTKITQALAFSFLRTVLYFLKLVMRSGMIVASTSYTALIIPVLVGLLFVVQMYYLRTSRQMRHLELESKSPLYAQLTETAEGLRHVRGFGWGPAYFDHTLKLIDAAHKPEYYMYAIERWLGLVTDLITLFIALILLGITLFTTYAVSSASVGLGLVSLISLSTTSMELIQCWTMLETCLGALTRVENLIKDTPQEQDPLNPVRLPEHWPNAGEVVMKDVVASYNVESTAPPALNGVSVTIPAGQKVGVVGRTGGGKSSLLLTILKLLDYSGTITIDGVNIATVPHHTLRSKITTISQDSIEFDASVRTNLSPWSLGSSGPSVSDDDMKRMLRNVGLWELVESNDGLDAKVSEVGLSQGQMQLLCIARACLHKQVTGSKLVVMDEATSNLDVGTEEQVQLVMNTVFADCTVVAVAHRVETLADASMLIRMKDGQIGDPHGE